MLCISFGRIIRIAQQLFFFLFRSISFIIINIRRFIFILFFFLVFFLCEHKLVNEFDIHIYIYMNIFKLIPHPPLNCGHFNCCCFFFAVFCSHRSVCCCSLYLACVDTSDVWKVYEHVLKLCIDCDVRHSLCNSVRIVQTRS